MSEAFNGQASRPYNTNSSDIAERVKSIENDNKSDKLPVTD